MIPFLKIALIAGGGIAYRVRGMGFSSPYSREICLFISALPVALGLFLVGIPWWAALLALVGTFGFDSLGHSKGMNYGSNTETTADEWSVLYTTGKASGLAACVALLAFGHNAEAALAFIAFSLKPIAYYTGWQIPSTIKNLEQGAPLGELLNGMFRMIWVIA